MLIVSRFNKGTTKGTKKECLATRNHYTSVIECKVCLSSNVLHRKLALQASIPADCTDSKRPLNVRGLSSASRHCPGQLSRRADISEISFDNDAGRVSGM